jgi:hypothetical protein
MLKIIIKNVKIKEKIPNFKFCHIKAKDKAEEIAV